MEGEGEHHVVGQIPALPVPHANRAHISAIADPRHVKCGGLPGSPAERDTLLTHFTLLGQAVHRPGPVANAQPPASAVECHAAAVRPRIEMVARSCRSARRDYGRKGGCSSALPSPRHLGCGL